jgi:O-antigen ligase
VISTAKTGRKTFAFLSALHIIITALATYREQYILAAIPVILLFFYYGWQHKNSIFFLLLLALPFSFEYYFNSSLATDIPDEFLMLLVSVLFLAHFVYYREARVAVMFRHPLIFLLLTAVAWLIVSVLFSSHPLLSVKFLLAKGWYIGAFILAPLIVFREKKQISTAAIILTAAMMTAAIISLIKHIGTGLSFATINEAVSPFFRNHVNYSAMLVCIVPVLVACFQLSNKRNQRLLIGVLIIIALTALFFSYARGAWLALVTGLLAWILIRVKLLVVSYIMAIIITIGAVFWLKTDNHYLRYAHDYQTTIFHRDFNEHLVATYKLKDLSTAERFYRWIAGVRMVKENWLTGYGPNTFYYHYKPYGVSAFNTWVSDNKEQSTVHNYFLLTTIEQGLPGLFFLLLLFGAMLFYAQHLYHRINDIFYRIAAITIGIILVMIITVNSLSDLIETDKVGSIFFLCLSLLIVIDFNSGKSSDSSAHIKGVS